MNTLSTFIREHRDEIVDEWLRRVAKLPSAQNVTPPSLRDHVPVILDRLADAIDRSDDNSHPLEALAKQHAALRFHEGYDLRQIVTEYRLLRRVVAELYIEHGDPSVDSIGTVKPLTVMHEAMDRAMSEAVDQYAVETHRVRDRFIAILGHDLRDPLNAILFTAHAQLTRSDELDDATVKATARTATAAKRMERMIADVLDFARGRLGGGFTVVPTPFDAGMLVSDAVHEIAHSHPERAVRCTVEHATGNFNVEWDRDRVEQVIANLVGNALVHGNDPVTVTLIDEGAEIRLRVSNGGEIPRDVLPRLFDPFVSDEPNGRRHGLGLGLYIVQQIAQAHGGTVEADSANGTTTMTVRLPRRVHLTRARD